MTAGAGRYARAVPSLPPFSVTWDYRCPFARVLHEHLLVGLAAGAEWDVRFVPFSLDQAHVEEGGTPVWENPAKQAGLLHGRIGIVARDTRPEHFAAVHQAMFDLRHEKGRDLRDAAVIRESLEEAGIDDVAGLLEEAAQPKWLDVYRAEHERSVEEHRVFGVPTFIVGDDATFVRFMRRPFGDADFAVATIERIVGMVAEWPDLNEFKHTRIRR